MLDQHCRDELHEEIGVGDSGAGLLADSLAPGDQPAHVDLAHQIEVGRAGPARGHALGHDAPDGADAGGFGPPRFRRRRSLGSADVSGEDGAARTRAANDLEIDPALGRQAPRLGRRGGEAERGAALDVGEHVGLLDPTAGRLHSREIDTVLLSKLAGQRRCFHGARRGAGLR